MKTIKVVAAIIKEEEYILAAQRGYGEFKNWWEFPGGKIEANESPEEALKREIREELEVEISVGDLFDTVEYDYENFHLSMKCYFCKIISGKITLKEHKNLKYLKKEELGSVNWLPADVSIIKKLIQGE